ncbi:MAG: phytoene desaturase family protein [Verrucomicrobiota bacterium]
MIAPINSNKKIAVIGTGPGGTAAAMLLASHGYQVEVFEKQPYIGGRNGALKQGDFTFDIGPTFLMMKEALEEVFNLSSLKIEDHLDLREIDPMYRLRLGDGRDFFPSRLDTESTANQIDQLFPGNKAGYKNFLKHEKKKFEHLAPCLKAPYESFFDLLTPNIFKALPFLDAHTSLFNHLGRYFKEDELKICFTFQAKYLGMSPWECPGIFSLIPHLEHSGGVWHPIGGLNQISNSMARCAEKMGANIHLNNGVKRILIKNKKAVGVELESGDKIDTDYVVMNADFAHAMHKLVDPQYLSRWSPDQLKKKKYSCSTFMLYLNVDKRYETPHHNILFARDYKKNITEIATTQILSDDPSIYIQNACVTDPTLAPDGKSAVYILAPLPNNASEIDWEKEAPEYRDKILSIAEERGNMPGLRQHILDEKVITPSDWESKYHVHLGATFNLAHNIGQMLLFRPHNRFEEFDNCYLVGGGTHPGSGLPTILESARISSELILKRDGRKFQSTV